MIIVFDLDDTLYEELSFVRSGFRVVSDFLSPILEMHRDQIYTALLEELKVKREHIFDRFLTKQKKNSKQLIKSCLSVYRGHEPRLTLYPEASLCLVHLQRFPLYIVTDGNKLVQRKKFLALGLDSMVKRCFFTYAHGLHRSKPSPYCFEKICLLEKASPSSVVYVADNPNKDFVGIKPLGFQTVRVLTGPYRNIRVEEPYDAHIKIPNLGSFDESLIEQLQLNICK
jgi:putative hydrolase of the HAD superfamily